MKNKKIELFIIAVFSYLFLNCPVNNINQNQSDIEHGYHIYVYNGSELKIVSTGNSGYYENFNTPIIFNDKVYFAGEDKDLKWNIYVINGDVINSINADCLNTGSEIRNPIIYNSKLYYFGYLNNKIVEFNGSSIKDISEGSSDYVNGFNNPIIYNSKLYFTSTFNEKIYEFDGSALKNISKGISKYNYGFSNPIIFNNKLYFLAKDSSQDEIFEFDGTNINDVPKGVSDYLYLSSDPNFITYNNKMYFCGVFDYSGNNLYKIYMLDSDNIIKNVPVGTSDYHYGFYSPYIFNSVFYFNGNSDYKLDNDIICNTNFHQYFFSNWVITFNSKIYLSSPDSIFIFDGNSIISTNKTTSDYQCLFLNKIIYQSKLYFTGLNLNDEFKLYYIEDKDIIRAFDSSQIYTGHFGNPIINNGKLYFSGSNY